MAGITLLNPGKCLGYGGYGGYGGDCYECDGWCGSRCLDYNRLWQVDVYDVQNLVTATSSTPNGGPVTSGKRRWGYIVCDILSMINKSHFIVLIKSPTTTIFPAPSGPFVECNFASGSVQYEITGTLYLSDIVAWPGPVPTTFVGFPFTLTVGVGLIIYDLCGLRTSSVYISIVALEYDDTSDVVMQVSGSGVMLSGVYDEREPCNVLPLTHDDVWYNSSSFFGYHLTGYRPSQGDPPFQSLWSAGSGLYTSLFSLGSSGTYYTTNPIW